jgi:microcompartment protein CcmL/EutN
MQMKYGAYAIVEVLGSANAVICVDQMLKTSDVHYLSKNTKCGGHTTIVMGGEVSAATAAVDAVKNNQFCEVFMAAVISAPSDELRKIVEGK